MSIESVFVVVGVIAVVVGLLAYLRGQRGGDGPTVGFVPRPFRAIVNAWFGLMDWPIPFDRAGHVIPVDERRRARER